MEMQAGRAEAGPVESRAYL